MSLCQQTKSSAKNSAALRPQKNYFEGEDFTDIAHSLRGCIKIPSLFFCTENMKVDKLAPHHII